eukprot:4787429-Amphidinium_carterae.2
MGCTKKHQAKRAIFKAGAINAGQTTSDGANPPAKRPKKHYLQDVQWALYGMKSSGNSNDKVAGGDQCEECYRLRDEAFPWIPWHELIKRYNEEKGFQKLLKDAREVRKGAIAAPAKTEHVTTEVTWKFQLEKTCVAMTEKELKKNSSMQRLSKVALRSLPSCTLPSEQGGEELVYLFNDPTHTGKRLHIIAEWCAKKQQVQLPSYTHLGQGDNVVDYVLQKWLTENGGGKLVEGTTLMDFDEFVEKKLSKAKDTTMAEEDEEDEGSDVEQWEGVAASSLQSTPHAAGKETSTPPDGLKRLSSKSGLGSAAGSVYGGDSATMAGEECDVDEEEDEGSMQ